MIAIFGAGNMGIKALKQIGPNQVSCFIDNNKIGELLGIPIQSMDVFRTSRSNSDVVVIPSKKYKAEMEQQLMAAGISNYFYFTPDEEALKGTSERLSDKEWGMLYNRTVADELYQKIQDKRYYVQTAEMLAMTRQGDSVLEIGCGGGRHPWFLLCMGAM